MTNTRAIATTATTATLMGAIVPFAAAAFCANNNNGKQANYGYPFGATAKIS